jgi:hypothetical protein
MCKICFVSLLLPLSINSLEFSFNTTLVLRLLPDRVSDLRTPHSPLRYPHSSHIYHPFLSFPSALRALAKPYKFDILPRRARPVPRIMGAYLGGSLFLFIPLLHRPSLLLSYRPNNLTFFFRQFLTHRLSVRKFSDFSRGGYLSPEIQIRNLKLFGSVTSEQQYRDEHDRFMVTKRKLLWPQDLKGYDAATHKEKKTDITDAVASL